MTNSTDSVTDQEKKIFKGFFELFCQYLRDQERESGTPILRFTFFLEKFYPHNPKCHQVIVDELGPALRTLGINLHIPTDSTATKETIFRDMWHNYNEGLDAFLNIYEEDDDRLAKVVNIAIKELISTAHNRTAARRNLERYIQENQWQVGPSQSETLAIFNKMKETLASAFAVLNNLKKIHKIKN